MNSYLDELKDIMTECLQAEGENVSKLEKADILELTVRHLQKLSQAQRLVLTRSPMEDIARFRHGYSSCAQEAAQFLVSVPGMDIRLGQRLVQHLLVQAQPQPHAVHHLVQQKLLSTLFLSSQSTPATSPPRSSPTSGHPSPSLPLPLSTRDSIKPWPLKPAARRVAVTQPTQEAVWKPYS